jgi:hypothetical protein
MGKWKTERLQAHRPRQVLTTAPTPTTLGALSIDYRAAGTHR